MVSDGEVEGEETSGVMITIVAPHIIDEIPEKYNHDFGVLLQDFQQGHVTIEQAIQILILWGNKSEFVPLHQADVQTDLILVDREHRNKMQEYKKSIYQKK